MIVNGINVVMRVSIVFNQSASVLVASKLYSVWVNCIDGSKESLSAVNNYALVFVVGGHCELGVCGWVNVCVSTDHGKFDVVSAAAVSSSGMRVL